MFFVKKSKTDINVKFVDSIVKSYFKYLQENTDGLSGNTISEVLRCAMCKQLGLQTIGYSRIVDSIALEVCSNVLNDIFKSYNIDELTLEYKQGLLEACVHCMEMSRMKAGV